ncbi:hypothetical protein ACJX0J_041982, partial [Zea mays]
GSTQLSNPVARRMAKSLQQPYPPENLSGDSRHRFEPDPSASAPKVQASIKLMKTEICLSFFKRLSVSSLTKHTQRVVVPEYLPEGNDDYNIVHVGSNISRRRISNQRLHHDDTVLPSTHREPPCSLLLHQESDNSAQLSQIYTEQLLAHLVETKMIKRMIISIAKEGRYKGRKFSSVFGLTGCMATVANLKDPIDKWRCVAAPLTAMMSVKRHLRGPGAIPKGRPSIHPSPIDLKGKAYELLREKASSFLLDNFYRTPGGIQFEGPGSDDYMGDIEILKEYLGKVVIGNPFLFFRV